MESLDLLLERYLGLLDEYQTMKTRLHDDLAAGYLSLARANFASSGRSRYGRDYYDERMHATRIVNITRPDNGPLSLKVVEVEEGEEEEEISDEKPAQGSENTTGSTNGESTKPKLQPRQKQVGGMVIGLEEVSDLADGFNNLDLSKTTAELTTPKGHPANAPNQSEHDESVPAAEPKSASLADEPSSATTQKNEKHKTDPIHMFGVLVPSALRQAQGSFVKAVAVSIPRLVELDGEMKELEIEIRRTRKMLLKQV